MRDLSSAGDGAAAVHGAGNGNREILATYRYRDEAGRLLYEVVRFAPKDFRQRRPQEGGGWSWSVKGVRRVPYRLPELRAADPAETVFIVEGEKDAERLAGLGLSATTNAGGAGKWQPEFAEHFRGRPVVVLPDNDEPGRNHAEHVARNLHGGAASVRVVALPGLPEKGDVSDWLDNGGNDRSLRELVETTPEWKPTPADSSLMICVADVRRMDVTWLWPGRIALGKLTLIQGDPEVGKSFVTLDVAARVSAGKPWPDQASTGQPVGDVFLLSAEDGVSDTIRPRLEAAGADLGRVFVMQGICSLASGLAELGRRIRENRNVRFVVIDPISSYLGTTDSHKNAEVRGLLAPLVSLAEHFGVAVLCVTHLNKSAEGPALYRASGSLAFPAAARAVWLVARDKQTLKRRLLLPIKSNLAPQTPGMAFHIVDSTVPRVGRVEWEPKPLSLCADEALSADKTLMEIKREREEATAWLRDVLAEEPIPVKDLQRMGRESGHAWATIRRAREEIEAESKRQGFGRGAVWYWVLPGQKWPPESIDAQNTIDAHAPGV